MTKIDNNDNNDNNDNRNDANLPCHHCQHRHRHRHRPYLAPLLTTLREVIETPGKVRPQRLDHDDDDDDDDEICCCCCCCCCFRTDTGIHAGSKIID